MKKKRTKLRKKEVNITTLNIAIKKYLGIPLDNSKKRVHRKEELYISR